MKLSNRNLILLIGGILILSLLAAVALRWFSPEGTRVVVTVGGREYGSYSLLEDRTVRIEAKDGSWYNILKIENGRADMIESDCANQICVNTPALREDVAGVIVCLPHGVTVELK